MRRRMQMRRAIDVREPTPRIVGIDRKLALKWSNRARIRSIDLVHGGPQWTTPATCVSLSTSIITPFAMEGLEFRRLMANAIKNFHFCFVDTSLSKDIKWCIWKKTGAEVPQMSAIYFFRFTEPNNRIMARIFSVKYFFDSTPCCSVPEWRLCRDFKGYSFGVSVFAAWLNTCCSKRSHRRCISRVYHSF